MRNFVVKVLISEIHVRNGITIAFWCRIILMLGGLVGFLPTLLAQEIELTLSRSVYLNEAVIRPRNHPKVDFPNINNNLLYKNKRLKKRITKYENKRIKDYHLLDSLYTSYIKQFGPRNFMKDQDLDMIWRLGQIKELLNDTSLALFYYSLALKNQSKHYKQVRLNYDGLKAPTYNEYVDLEYYYRIVQARLEIDTLIPPPGVQLKMSDNINTAFPEYGPSLHPSSLVLIFTSRRPETYVVGGLNYNQNEDLYLTIRDPDELVWQPPKRLPYPITSPYNEGSACLNADGTKIIFIRCNDPNGFGNCDLYEAAIKINPENGDVTVVDKVPRNLGPKVNSNSWDSHPCLSADGKNLFFASNRRGGFGRTDLYICKLQSDGTWGKAENLGPIVNTIDDEVSPYLSTVNNTLYFSSKGHVYNYGGFDIYKSRWFDGWEEPQNLGPLVNTTKDEYYFTLDAKGDTLIYATDSVGNPDDLNLYSYAMPMAGRPDAVVTLSGYLIDSVSHRPLTGIIMALDLDRNIEIEPIYINKYGYFEFHLVNNGKYQLYVLGEDAIRISSNDDMAIDSIFSVFDFSLEKGKPVIIDAMEFSKDNAEISDSVDVHLEYIANYLLADRERKLIIRGHTDADGDPNYNLRLSQERSNNIKRYLMEKTGLADSMFVAIGAGSSKPIFPNDSPENKARNRRVEFEFIPSEDDVERMREEHQQQVIQEQQEAKDSQENEEFIKEPTEEEDPLKQIKKEKEEVKPDEEPEEDEKPNDD